MESIWHHFDECAHVALSDAGEPFPAQACVYDELVLGSWTFVRWEPAIAHHDGLIVAVAGASRAANLPNPRGGSGVFFGRDSARNVRRELDGPANAANDAYAAARRDRSPASCWRCGAE